MTPGEILKKHYEKLKAEHPKENWAAWDASDPSIEMGVQAMKEYAAQEAAGFAEWIRTNPVYVAEPGRYTYKGQNTSTSDLYAIYKKGGEGVCREDHLPMVGIRKIY